MITVQQATEIIRESGLPYTYENVPLSAAVGRRLGRMSVRADRDLPPFHRATMDGIAISFDAFQKGARQFEVQAVQAAGQPALTLLSPMHCVEIMTGAMLPGLADTVVRYEDVTIASGKATILVEHIEKGQSIHAQGIDARQGEVLLTEGARLTPAEIALLASVGIAEVPVIKFKSVAIVSTGDELVDVESKPELWQIRRSNGVALAAALKELNIDSVLHHLPDQEEKLKRVLQTIIDQHDVVILTGGVSKGKFDYVPKVLESLGVERKFHQVKQRPGKPFWFGRRKDQHITKSVFALPGNPVSTFLCFYRYVRPMFLSGGQPVFAQLASDFQFKPDLTYFLQVRVEYQGGHAWAHPIPGEGSGDFVNLRQVDGFLELPSDRVEFKKGESFPFIGFRNK